MVSLIRNQGQTNKNCDHFLVKRRAKWIGLKLSIFDEAGGGKRGAAIEGLLKYTWKNMFWR